MAFRYDVFYFQEGHSVCIRDSERGREYFGPSLERPVLNTHERAFVRHPRDKSLNYAAIEALPLDEKITAANRAVAQRLQELLGEHMHFTNARWTPKELSGSQLHVEASSQMDAARMVAGLRKKIYEILAPFGIIMELELDLIGSGINRIDGPEEIVPSWRTRFFDRLRGKKPIQRINTNFRF